MAVRHRVLICAHRGASAGLPDNSLAAFEAAIAMGADMIETDVRRGSDGSLVLSHDRIEDDAGCVRLTELVALARGRAGLDIELKEPGLEEDALAIIGPLSPASFVSSFDPGVVARIAAISPATRTALIVGEDATGDPFELAGGCGSRALAVHRSLATPRLLAEAARLQSPLIVWTVNAEADLGALLADRRVGVVITDVPDVAARIRRAGPVRSLP